ncbi:tetratricopeptide repeat protein [Alistipes ihumii]|uniref:tetratricopeptide repeat protein n=1 Tax=Alistipes ihumii TaxID=1470347 RepID=UPI003AAA2836
MRKIFLLLLVLAAWLPGYRAQAQLNKAYFFYAGRSFLIESKYRDAIEVLNILLRADSTAYEGYFLRGIAKYNLDDLIGADQDFSEAIRKNPVFTTAFQYRAITRMRMGNYDDALRDFQEAIDLRPDLPGPYYSRGVTYLLSQQFEKAIEDFNTFIRYDNKVSDAYINRGTSYLYLKDTTRALEDYNTAIRTNYFDPAGYNRRGALYMAQKKYDLALADFDKAVGYDSTYVPSYFHRAMVYSSTKRPVQAIEDFSRAIALDSTNALTYFNRAILRTQIGDYNRALDDYNRVAFYSPNNVLVYYNRAALYAQLGDYEAAIRDYSRAIELYPDFANAYLGRSSLRYMTNDLEGSRSDKQTAERKIAEYRSKLNDSTFSIYADTSRRFNQLLSFESEFAGNRYESLNAKTGNIALLPMFKFSLMTADTLPRPNLPGQYYVEQSERFLRDVGDRGLRWVNRDSDLPADTLFVIDAAFVDRLRGGDDSWQAYFLRGVSQSLIRQYTSSIANYTAAIDRNPSNPFLYVNRSTTQSEMIDFISSIDNGYQRIAVDSDPSSRLKTRSDRVYDYDEAIADLNKAAKLLPDFAYIYYNRGNLLCLSGRMPEAIEDYTRAIELNPSFGEAYYNRGLIQIYLKDTRKGCLDMSKAGELGVADAYKVLRIYGQPPGRTQ